MWLLSDLRELTILFLVMLAGFSFPISEGHSYLYQITYLRNETRGAWKYHRPGERWVSSPLVSNKVKAPIKTLSNSFLSVL